MWLRYRANDEGEAVKKRVAEGSRVISGTEEEKK